MGWLFGPSTGWGISFDVGVTTVLGDDASLVSVNLNLEWIATQD